MGVSFGTRCFGGDFSLALSVGIARGDGRHSPSLILGRLDVDALNIDGAGFVFAPFNWVAEPPADLIEERQRQNQKQIVAFLLDARFADLFGHRSSRNS